MGARITKLMNSFADPPHSTVDYVRHKSGGVLTEHEIRLWYKEFNVSGCFKTKHYKNISVRQHHNMVVLLAH